MTYILILFLTYVLHLLLKLNWVCTAVVLVFLLVMQHFHRIKGQRFQEARKRFLDVSLYIDTLLYSFLKEQKIIRAFEDVKSTLADGHMKETVSRAIDHMMLTFDETEVFVDAMRIIEDSYYGKTVRGLFHTIDVRKSTGISCVSGGRYILLWYICDNQCKQFCRI